MCSKKADALHQVFDSNVKVCIANLSACVENCKFITFSSKVPAMPNDANLIIFAIKKKWNFDYIIIERNWWAAIMSHEHDPGALSKLQSQECVQPLKSFSLPFNQYV